MPVFGVVHGDNNAFIASIESGDPYSEILAYPAGVTTTYNWVAAKFNYRYTYFQPIDKKVMELMLIKRIKISLIY